jgi:hypothetical protein
MSTDINHYYHHVVSVPELTALTAALLAVGEKLVGELSGINEGLAALTANQADGQAALSEHLTAIEEEIRQLGENPTQAQLDAIAEQIHAAAAVSAKGAQDLRTMTDQVKGMVPDAPLA